MEPHHYSQGHLGQASENVIEEATGSPFWFRSASPSWGICNTLERACELVWGWPNIGAQADAFAFVCIAFALVFFFVAFRYKPYHTGLEGRERAIDAG